jgi:polyisoprenoid-binding protein YceI
MFGMMARVGAVILLAVLVVASFVAYDYLKPTAAASGPIEAIAVQPTQATDSAGQAVVFEIDQAASEARYVIDEVLRGEPFTVVGETDQVAGQFAVDLSDFDAAQLGVIQINARALATDSSQRDRAVQNQVLLTNEHEYITFAPTALVGLPAELAVGETAAFQVIGDLTIRGVTNPATFEVSLTPAADDRLTGSATTTVRFADWGISIPNVPMVTGVSEEARLELAFEAAA